MARDRGLSRGGWLGCFCCRFGREQNRLLESLGAGMVTGPEIFLLEFFASAIFCGASSLYGSSRWLKSKPAASSHGGG